MNYYPPSIQNVIKNISRLPGIGEKTAERLALHILKTPRIEAEHLARSILELKDKIRLCSRCFALSDSDLCSICSNPARDSSLLCVVEQPADMVAVEKSGAFQGLYHILSGVLSPMNGVGPGDIKIRELVSRLKEGNVKEVVLATGTNIEGEATASYIAQLVDKLPVKVTRIASGVPMGGDLKYVDQVTLKRAMETRHNV
ncbi:MAG: recombination mediator RecR [Thermodesulfobacteriota bacterium]|nr:recombination mediator RecR [Thermodesulfobacteriota bacterium]